MNIDQAKAEIARRVLNAGFTFDPNEIITGPLEGRTAVILRSVRALRTIERDDGTFTTEEFNKPIVWVDIPSPMIANPIVKGTFIHYTVYAPQVRMLYPEFVVII
jgi:hypothetical protein